MDDFQSCGLDEQSVLSALDALRLARSIEAHHPLNCFESFHNYFTESVPIREDIRRTIRVFDGLAQVIRENLNDLRIYYCLRPALENETHKSMMTAWCIDFKQENMELEAWSYLYYRFIQGGLGLSMDCIALQLRQAKRTLNRRQQVGISRLTIQLIKRELAMRDHSAKVLSYGVTRHI